MTKLSKLVENNVGKGELLVTSNFTFYHSVFKGLVLLTGKKQGRVWERANSLPNNQILD